MVIATNLEVCGRFGSVLLLQKAPFLDAANAVQCQRKGRIVLLAYNGATVTLREQGAGGQKC